MDFLASFDSKFGKTKSSVLKKSDDIGRPEAAPVYGGRTNLQPLDRRIGNGIRVGAPPRARVFTHFVFHNHRSLNIFMFCRLPCVSIHTARSVCSLPQPSFHSSAPMPMSMFLLRLCRSCVLLHSDLILMHPLSLQPCRAIRPTRATKIGHDEQRLQMQRGVVSWNAHCIIVYLYTLK